MEEDSWFNLKYVEKEEIPIDWKMGIVCPIYKKGNRNKCNNYREIML